MEENKGKTLVSVIIPTYKRPDFLLRAIESVRNQTYKNIEIFVVDDNGLGTEWQVKTHHLLVDLIQSGAITYITHDVNRNGSAARNTGITASKGSYITFLDDDDVLLPQKIEKQVDILENHKGYDAVYTGFDIFKGEKKLKSVIPTSKGNLQYELLSTDWSIGTGSNPMFRRCVFEDIGLFDVSFIRHQDIEFLVRFFRTHEIGVVSEILINRYIDSAINRIDCERLIQVKDKFLLTFKKDIENFQDCKRNTILRNQYADIACNAIKERNYSVAIKYYKKANKYKLLSLKIIAKAIAYGLLSYKVE